MERIPRTATAVALTCALTLMGAAGLHAARTPTGLAKAGTAKAAPAKAAATKGKRAGKAPRGARRARVVHSAARDRTAPTVNVVSPVAGSTVSGTTWVKVSATDASGIARVDASVDGALLYSDTTSPYGDGVAWNTAKAVNGTHTLRAVAYDTRGNSTTRSWTVTVANTTTSTSTTTTTTTVTPPPPPPPPSTSTRLLWGAYVDGDRWGWGDAPWDTRTMDKFEAQAGKRMSVVHWGQAWYRNGAAQPFYPGDYERVRTRGAIPMVDWSPWDTSLSPTNQPDFQLADVASGTYDSYIRSWATGAKTWGKPLFIRMGHEMNGTWFPWSEQVNGNQPGQFVQAWRHVVDVTRSVGATNISWVWCPNTVYPGSTALPGLYPGDSYVDWTCADVYNWGTNPTKPSGWTTLTDAFGPTYSQITSIAPGKPMVLGEMGSSEYGGSKAAWITDALTREIPTTFPAVRGVLWFDWNADGMDWAIESSPSATAAFAQAIADPRYTGADFGGLAQSPIPAP